MKHQNKYLDDDLKKSLLKNLGIDESAEQPKQDAMETECSIAPWIYVKDRLPQHCEVVAIPWKNSLGYKLAQFMDHGITQPNRRNFFCKTDDIGFDDCHVYYGVKAWLPIPKPKSFLLPENEGYYEF